MSLDAAVASLDKLLVSLEGSLPDAPPLRVDPDDPHLLHPPEGVYKVRCPTTGYLRTLPFEKNCPLPGAFTSDSAWLDGLLKPVIKPKGAGAPSAALVLRKGGAPPWLQPPAASSAAQS